MGMSAGSLYRVFLWEGFYYGFFVIIDICISHVSLLPKNVSSIIILLTDFEREKKDFYGQDITDEVLEFIRQNPSMLAPVRKGNKLYCMAFPCNRKASVKFMTCPRLQWHSTGETTESDRIDSFAKGQWQAWYRFILLSAVFRYSFILHGNAMQYSLFPFLTGASMDKGTGGEGRAFRVERGYDLRV